MAVQLKDEVEEVGLAACVVKDSLTVVCTTSNEQCYAAGQTSNLEPIRMMNEFPHPFEPVISGAEDDEGIQAMHVDLAKSLYPHRSAVAEAVF